MSRWDDGLLTSAQSDRVAAWLDAPSLIEDMSWGIVESTVLHVRSGERDLIVKAGGATNHHIDREIDAHDGATAPLVEQHLAARLLHADRADRVLVLEYLPGSLAAAADAETDADIHRQAGAALRLLHLGYAFTDETYEQRVTERTLAWLDGEHRIDAASEREARRLLVTQGGGSVTVVPTHGDWQPRNWLVDEGMLRVIDFGRFAYRPASTDLCRLAAQQWRLKPALADAFTAGYGSDLREDPRWPLEQLREAVGTAAYAFQIGDEAFEAQGHRMLAEALGAL